MNWPLDVFVCYSKPTGQVGDELARYSDRLVATLRALVNPNHYDWVSEVGFLTSFDKVDDDDGVVKAGRCAVLLVLLTPQLITDAARCAEIVGYCKRALEDGRNFDQILLVELLPTAIETDLARDLASAFRAGRKMTFFDPDTGEPREQAAIAQGKPFAELIPDIQRLANDLRKRVDLLRRIAPRPAIAPLAFTAPPTAEPYPSPSTLEALGGIGALAPESAASLVPGQIYLQASSSEQHWRETCKGLAPPLAVNPEKWSAPEFNLATLRQRNEARRDYLTQCQGLVFVRATPDDPLARNIAAAVEDFRVLSPYQKPLPWVIVDWIDDQGPQLQHGVAVPRVVAASNADWPQRVRRLLGL